VPNVSEKVWSKYDRKDKRIRLNPYEINIIVRALSTIMFEENDDNEVRQKLVRRLKYGHRVTSQYRVDLQEKVKL